MYIAKQKRKDNIAEYILYIWQLEDLFRAMNFDENMIYDQLVAPQTTLNNDQKQSLIYWYIDMINLMKSEGIGNHGHLEHTLHLIDDINDLHLRLLKLPLGKDYASRFAVLSPELPRLKTLLKDENISDIEACFKALYSVMLLRLKDDSSSSKHIADVIDSISPVIALLSKAYGEVERGEVDLFKNSDE